MVIFAVVKTTGANQRIVAALNGWVVVFIFVQKGAESNEFAYALAKFIQAKFLTHAQKKP